MMTDDSEPTEPMAHATTHISIPDSATTSVSECRAFPVLRALPAADLDEGNLHSMGITPIEAATSAVPSDQCLTPRGVFASKDQSGETDTPFLGPLRVTAKTCDERGGSWGLRLEWLDDAGNLHTWCMPKKFLAGDVTLISQRLLDEGLYIASDSGASQKLKKYLNDAKPKKVLRVVPRGGWHVKDGRSLFVLSDTTLVAEGATDVFLQTDNPGTNPAVAQGGTLADWQENIAAFAEGNSRLGISLCAGFGAPLIALLLAESGGLHFQGPSSIGKSTALKLAASIYYGGSDRAGFGSWRATDNSLEASAAAHCDLLLTLDEMGEADPATVGRTAYMLANGRGKGRANQDGSGRPPAEWRVLFVSSGEVGLNELIQTAGRGDTMVRAGQEVRIIDLPAQVGPLGLFETCYSFATPKDFAESLSAATKRYYGTAGMVWLRYLVTNQDQVTAAAQAIVKDFALRYTPVGASGQVHRVASRFGLLAAAGEIAAQAGILPWKGGEAIRVAATCFAAWLQNRPSGEGQAEQESSLSAVRGFIAKYGDSRFAPLGRSAKDAEEVFEEPVSGTTSGARLSYERAGYRKADCDGLLYLIDREVWKKEVCAGLNPQEVARILAEKGHLMRGDGDNLTASHRIPGMKGKKVRFYTVRSSILAE